MTKLRKQRRRKVYRHNVNRKRMRNKMCRPPKIECKDIKSAWENNKSVKRNMLDMGLSYDPNATIKFQTYKQKLKLSLKSNDNSEWTEQNQADSCPKSHVVESLEKEAKTPRVKLFKLPKGQVEWITYLMDKYGTDYKAMERDKKNHYQETWRQLRAKINRFKSIPAQYKNYLNDRGLTEDVGVSDDIVSD